MKRYSPDSGVILAVLICLFSLLVVSNQAIALTVQTGSFRIDIQGKKTWTVEFGLGDGESLSRVGYPKDSYSLAQTLKVNMTGQLGEYFSLNADLDDTKPGYLQEFGLKMDTDNWDGQVGDFGTGNDNFTVYNKKILGIELSGNLGGSQLSVVAGRLQGISETKVFYGNTGESEIEYSLYQGDARLNEASYTKNIRGLQYYELAIDYVKGFTDPELQFQPADDLWNFLEEWEFGYLQEVIEEEPNKELSSGQFDVVSRQIDYLILLSEWKSLVRSRIKSYITRYNQDLPEDQKKKYPFNVGTEYETNFLRKLSERVNLSVGQSTIQLTEYKNNRFYYLGRTGIKEGGFQLEVRPDGDWVGVEDLSGYDFDLYPEKGLIELQFPEDFFRDLETRGVRAKFKYKISGKMYSLGFSVAPNSEKVYLNGELLERNTDYSIDYETGSLLIFREVGAEDKIKVDFERARGGLGGFAQFARNMYGFSTRMKSDYGLVMDVSLFQARDTAPAELPPEIPTMPNVHSVGGVRARYEENGWNASVRFTGNINRFPSDDNSRVNLPNKIEKILSLDRSGTEMTLFAHKNGFTVKDQEGWTGYGPKDGLAGNNVNDGLIVDNLLVLGTNAGVTTVKLSGPSPFARATNWTSYYESDGLPESEVVGLAGDGDKIWAATESGIAETKTSTLAEDGGWKKVTSDFGLNFSLLSITYQSDHLWLGTDKGLYLFDLTSAELVEEDPIVDGRINDMEISGDKIIVATPDGIVRVGLDSEKESLVQNRDVESLSVEGGNIWFGTGDGFTKIGSSTNYGDKIVTAILSSQSKVWAGSEGYGLGDSRDLVVYELGDELNKFFTEKTKIAGSDSDRYQSIDPAMHTNRGISLMAEIGKKLELGSQNVYFSTIFEYVQPTYSPIGKLERKDRISTGLRLDANITESFSLGLSSDYSVSSLSTEERNWSVSNQLSADWQTIVDVSAAASWSTREGGKNVLGLDFGLSKGLWKKSLVGSIDLSTVRETDPAGEVSNFASIFASIGFSPGDSTNLSLNYSYPLTFGSLEARSDEELGWKVDYSRGVILTGGYGAKLNLSGKGTARDLLGGDHRSFKNQSELRMDLDRFSVSGFNLTPYLSLSWEGSNSSNKFTGEISGRGTVANFSSRTTVSRSVGFSANSKLVEYEDKIRGKVSYEYEPVTPKLNYSLSRVLLSHPEFGEKSRYRADLTLGAKWQPRSNLSNEFKGGVGYKPDRGLTYTLTDVINWKLTNKLTPEVSLEMEYLPKTQEWDFSAESGFSYPIRDRWGISFTSGFNLGTDETGEVHNSFFGAAGLQVKF